MLTLTADDQTVTVALNLDDATLRVEAGEELLAGNAERTGDRWDVPAHGWAVLT